MSINSVVETLFKTADDQVTNYFKDIHLNQNELTASPNFHFKGEVHLPKKGKPVNKLHPSLQDTFIDIKAYSERVIEQKTSLRQLLRLALNGMFTEQHLYLVFPKSAYHLLPEFRYPPEAAIHEFVNHTYDEQIALIVNEHIMKSLI